MNPYLPELSDSELHKRNRNTRVVLSSIVVVTIVLGVLLFINYSRFLMYIDDHLDSPTESFPWESREHVPVEACVDYAMDWASECTGIKTLCDEYVTRYMKKCMGSESRRTYCEVYTIDKTGTTTFGSDECAARGVRRNVDAEACSKAYRAIDSWCRYERDLQEAGLTHQENASHDPAAPSP